MRRRETKFKTISWRDMKHFEDEILSLENPFGEKSRLPSKIIKNYCTTPVATICLRGVVYFMTKEFHYTMEASFVFTWCEAVM